MRFPRKSSTAPIAHEIAFVGVCSCVYAQFADQEKFSRAKFTFVRSNFGMGLHMLLQYIRRCEATFAFYAFEWFQSCVNGRMTFQRRFTIKRSIARIAFERFFALNEKRSQQIKSHLEIGRQLSTCT